MIDMDAHQNLCVMFLHTALWSVGLRSGFETMVSMQLQVSLCGLQSKNKNIRINKHLTLATAQVVCVGVRTRVCAL